MARMNTAERDAKKSLAYTLYTENGFDQKLIAEKLKVSENTISKWKTDGKWQEAREEARNGISNRRKRILSTFDRMMDQIEQRDPPDNVPTPSESNTLSQMTSSIQKLETELSLAHKSEAGKQFINYVQSVHGHARAVEVLDLWNQFIMSQVS